MGTHRSYIWCHQEPSRPTGTRQGIHDATSQWMCCGKWSALWTSYVILKRVPAYKHKSISWNLFIFGPMLIGTFLLILGWGIPRKSLWQVLKHSIFQRPYPKDMIRSQHFNELRGRWQSFSNDYFRLSTLLPNEGTETWSLQLHYIKRFSSIRRELMHLEH